MHKVSHFDTLVPDLDKAMKYYLKRAPLGKETTSFHHGVGVSIVAFEAADDQQAIKTARAVLTNRPRAISENEVFVSSLFKEELIWRMP